MNENENMTKEQKEALGQLIKELSIETLSKDKQNEIIIKMTEVLLKRIFLETMERLSDEERNTYEKLTEREDVTPAQVETFFKEKINNYEEMVQGVIAEFKNEMTVSDEKQVKIENKQTESQIENIN